MADEGTLQFVAGMDGSIAIVDPDGEPGNLDGTPGYATGAAAGSAVASAFSFIGWLPYILLGVAFLLVADETKK